uniref:F5/8 type C domain-containing protein n=1 Tax=Hucho hucho TaxID=62062 RepID=A0A4W5R055_9TELE
MVIHLNVHFLNSHEWIIINISFPSLPKSSPVCLAAIHAVSLSGCYGTLGLESGVVRDSQLFASSVWKWSDVIGEPSEWGPTGARLNGVGLPWASAHSDQQQWLQVDLKKEKRITGITTTGSSLLEYQFYVSAYRVLYMQDGVVCFYGNMIADCGC